MNKPTKNILYILIVLAILAALAIPKISFTDENDAVRPEFKQQIEVKAKVIVPQSLSEDFFASANLLSYESVMLRSETSGKIIEMNIEEGRAVKEGELLIKINDAELQAQKKQAEKRIELLEDKEYRLKNLLKKEGVSQEEYDIALNELKVEKAQIEFINAQIEKTEVRAPFDGIIGLRNISKGAYITPQTDIAPVEQINQIKLEFTVPQKYYSKIKTGDEIEFSIPYLSDIFKAKVYAIEPKIDEQTRNVRIRAITPNKESKLVPGAYAEVKINIDENESAFLIPTEALIPELGGEKVFLAKNGKAVPQKVAIGMRTPDNVQITSGLNKGDTVIISGIIQLRPGIDVSITELSNNQ
jgi:membrane fusion protein (multidrug efflux system)